MRQVAGARKLHLEYTARGEEGKTGFELWVLYSNIENDQDHYILPLDPVSSQEKTQTVEKDIDEIVQAFRPLKSGDRCTLMAYAKSGGTLRVYQTTVWIEGLDMDVAERASLGSSS